MIKLMHHNELIEKGFSIDKIVRDALKDGCRIVIRNTEHKIQYSEEDIQKSIQRAWCPKRQNTKYVFEKEKNAQLLKKYPEYSFLTKILSNRGYTSASYKKLLEEINWNDFGIIAVNKKILIKNTEIKNILKFVDERKK